MIKIRNVSILCLSDSLGVTLGLHVLSAIATRAVHRILLMREKLNVGNLCHTRLMARFLPRRISVQDFLIRYEGRMGLRVYLGALSPLYMNYLLRYGKQNLNRNAGLTF